MHRPRNPSARSTRYRVPATVVTVLALALGAFLFSPAASAAMPWPAASAAGPGHRHHWWQWGWHHHPAPKPRPTPVGTPTAMPTPSAPTAAPTTPAAVPSTASTPAATEPAATGTPAPTASTAPGSAYSSTAGTKGTFSAAVPALPEVASSALMGTMDQGDRVDNRDGGASASVNGRSWFIYADTILKPWSFVSNSAAVTTDLNLADGFTLDSGNAFSTAAAAPQTLIPHTAAETAWENAHNKEKTGCTPATDQYCGAVFGYWPGETVADPDHDRVLVYFGKICRMGGKGTPCADQWKNLGTGIAAIDLKTQQVTRLTMTGGTPVRSVEGIDPTLGWAADAAEFTGSVVTDGQLYARGGCDFWHCMSAKVALKDVTDLSAYRYWDGDAWVPDPARAVKTAAAGGSTFYDAELKLWMNVSLPWGNDEVIYQVAGRPQGPFSGTRTALTVPKGNGVKYSMFVHTEFARDNGLTQYLTWFDQQSGQQKLGRISFVR